MNSFSWEFSKEAQPELNIFLEAVNQNKNKGIQFKEKFQELFVELKEKCENKSHFQDTILKSELFTEDDNIEVEKEVYTETETNLSTFNNTQVLVNQSEENILNNDVDIFIEYLIECLENENRTLDSEFMLKLVNYNFYSLHYLFTKLYNRSENSLYNLNKSLCKYSASPMKNIPEIFCKVILFPKIQETNPTKKLLLILKEFSETFPEDLRKQLLNLIITDGCDGNFFQTVVNILSDAEKQFLLRDFVYTTNELELWQLSILESLLSSKTEDTVQRRLINLMEVSADKFNTEKLFTKLLIVIINNLKSDFEDQEPILSNLVEKSKTVNRATAQKALAKWINKFIDE